MQTKRQTNGRMDQQMDRQMDGWTWPFIAIQKIYLKNGDIPSDQFLQKNYGLTA